MLDRNQNFEEPEELKDIDESSEDVVNDSDDFAEASLAKVGTATESRSANGKGTAARKMLEEYREDRALRKAIYDDLYGFDEEE